MSHVATVVSAVLVAGVSFSGAVGDDHVVSVSGLEHGGERVSRLSVEDLGGVGVVGGDDHEGVAQINVLHGVGDGLIEIVGFTDLAASVACVILLVDRSAFNLQEVAVRVAGRVGFEQIERLLGHVSERGAPVAEPVGVRGAYGRVGVFGRVLGGGLGWVELGRHVAVAHQGEHRLAFLVFERVHGSRIVLDGLVAHSLGLLPHGLASVFAALNGLAEVLGTAADGHVGAGIEQLLGNRTDAAVLLELIHEATFRSIIRGTVGLALRTVAATLGGVRFEHGRGGVLDFGGGHIAGGLACRLGEFEQIELRIAINVYIDRVVVSLSAGCPCGAGCGGIGHCGKLARVRVGVEAALVILADRTVAAVAAQREGGVLTGAGIGVAELCRLADCVKAFKVTVCTLQVIAGDGNFGIAHAVANEQDDVLGVAIADGRNALCAAVLSQFRNGLAVQIVSGSFVGECRCGECAERRYGCDRRDCALQSFTLAHVSSFFHAVSSVPSNLPFQLRPLGNAHFDPVFRLRGTFPRLHLFGSFDSTTHAMRRKPTHTALWKNGR